MDSDLLHNLDSHKSMGTDGICLRGSWQKASQSHSPVLATTELIFAVEDMARIQTIPPHVIAWSGLPSSSGSSETDWVLSGVSI